ncbi:MAG: transposase, partial [Paludibacteraceae bacterium]|nr:transposase [Paludibacteraceae bacterium]
GEFQRMVIGTYHRLSKKHLQRYLDELVFRYNSLELDVEDRYMLMFEKAYCVDYKMVELRRRMNKYQLKTDMKLVA